MAWWSGEEYQIQTLAWMLMVSWDKETRKNTIDALASYRAKALPVLPLLYGTKNSENMP